VLNSLSISNYALINSLEIQFKPGFNVITGETGAGKSILLGALSLILGQRADSVILKDKEKKCVVEGIFDLTNYDFRDFFKEIDVDYEDKAILRREISAGGKSRAFINDTPVNLSDLKNLASNLTDIHSQHKNPELNDLNFQLMMIDSLANSNADLKEYKTVFRDYKRVIHEYNELFETAENSKKEADFSQYRFEELSAAKLSENEQTQSEEELKNLTHAEEIKRNLTEAHFLLSEELIGALPRIHTAVGALTKISGFHKKSVEFSERTESAFIELKDLSSEIEITAENIDFDQSRITFLKDRLDLIYSLQKKHNVETVSELLKIQADIFAKLSEIASFDENLELLKFQIENIKRDLEKKSNALSRKRISVFEKTENKIGGFLSEMGMPWAKFKIMHTKTEDFTETGTDKVSFLFSANKSGELTEIARVASGGEISRLMLSIKALIADSVSLPTVIFDEIDTGVSGEIAGKMGEIMLQMSKNMQVIDITHLPQIAAKADFQYFVYKTEDNIETNTQIKLLTEKERIAEIAKMLSGQTVTEAAMQNAAELLKQR
jgi:DNA repair protein RecN (Recombination protein N)